MESEEISSTTVRVNFVNGYPAAGQKYILYIDTEAGKYAKIITDKTEMVHAHDQINLKDGWTIQVN